MTSYGLLLLCALTITLQVHDVTSWTFSPSSLPLLPTKHEDDFGLSVTIMCQADTALDKCQVNMYDKDYSHDFIDLSRGSNSGVISRYHERHSKVPMYNASYFGTGLENGQCGAVYSLAAPMAFHFGCRGANAAGEWQDMDLVLANSPEAIPASITPLKAIVEPGSEVTVLLHSQPMLYCMLVQTAHTHPPFYIMEGSTSVTTESYRYFGSGLSLGDCGITLLNVTEDNNGPMSIMGVTNNHTVAQLVSTVIVATPPSQVDFRVLKPYYSIGLPLRATCSSLLSRPVANLTWILDDRIIRQDTKKDIDGDVWTWSWDKQNITQELFFNVKQEHFGKKLECRVQHLDRVYSKSMVISDGRQYQQQRRIRF